FVGEVDAAVLQNRRAPAGLDTVLFPHQLGLAVFDLGTIQTNDAALDVVVGVFFSVADVDEVAVDDRRNIDRAGAEFVAPELLAGADLHADDRAVGGAGHELALAGDDGDGGDGIIGVLGSAGGFRPPDHGAGALVHGEEAIAALGQIAPRRVEHADDDQVFI